HLCRGGEYVVQIRALGAVEGIWSPVKAFHTEYELDKWAPNGTPKTEVLQGTEGNCIFMSALASVASHTDLTSRIHYRGAFRFDVSLYSSASRQWTEVPVTFNGRLTGDLRTPNGEFWTVLFSRAYDRFLGN